jgi:hypothetical protein
MQVIDRFGMIVEENNGGGTDRILTSFQLPDTFFLFSIQFINVVSNGPKNDAKTEIDLKIDCYISYFDC